MKVYVCTEEPYHDNSTVCHVFLSRASAAKWLAALSPGITWRVFFDDNKKYQRGQKWIVERSDVSTRGELFNTEKEACDWIEREGPFKLSDDYAITEMDAEE